MSRMAFAAIAVLAVSAGPHAKATVADLSGTWVLTASPGPAVDPTVRVRAFGPTITINQSANSVTLVDAGLSVTYQADLLEHDLPKVPHLANTVWYFTDASTSGLGTYRASLNAAQLVVVRRDSVSVGEGPRERKIGRVIRQAFAPSGDGTLVIDTLMVVDPLGIEFFNQPATPENPPSNIRTVYRKQ